MHLDVGPSFLYSIFFRQLFSVSHTFCPFVCFLYTFCPLYMLYSITYFWEFIIIYYLHLFVKLHGTAPYYHILLNTIRGISKFMWKPFGRKSSSKLSITLRYKLCKQDLLEMFTWPGLLYSNFISSFSQG